VASTNGSRVEGFDGASKVGFRLLMSVYLPDVEEAVGRGVQRVLVQPWCIDPPGSARRRPGIGDHPLLTPDVHVPFKLNQDRRHHIPRQRHRVTNWRAYEAGLRQRGSLTVWLPTRRSKPGRPSRAPPGVANLGIRPWRS
jgi:hypothetical protein